MKLFYQKVKGRFMLEKIKKSGGDTLTFVLSEKLFGRLCIGGTSVTLSDGRASVFLASLPNGTLFPRVYTGSESYPLDTLEKHGSGVAPTELSVEELYEMRLCLAKLRERTESLEALTGSLLERVPDTTVF